MKQEDILFFVGLFFLAMCLFFFPFAVYLSPMAWFGWDYYVPNFVIDTTLWLQVYFNMSYKQAFFRFAESVFLIAIISGGLAYWISRKISMLEHHETDVKADIYVSRKIKSSSQWTVVFMIKMVVIISLVFLVANMIQWVISSTPPAP